MGATLIKVPGHFSPCSFNPRTRKGCDHKAGLTDWITYVSIHAPVKDATYGSLDHVAFTPGFQSTHP